MGVPPEWLYHSAAFVARLFSSGTLQLFVASSHIVGAEKKELGL